MKYKKIACISSYTEKAQATYNLLKQKYKNIYFINDIDGHIKGIDLLLVLGGDGFMINTIHNFVQEVKNFYGINCGRIGFLLNKFDIKNNLMTLLENTTSVPIDPIVIEMENTNNELITTYAINEFYFLRKGSKAITLDLEIENQYKIQKIIGDGIIVSTGLGSTGYCYSAKGPIIPINSSLLVIIPINTFYPRNLGSMVVDSNTKITITFSPEKSATTAIADIAEFSNIKKVIIQKATNVNFNLLFQSQETLNKKIQMLYTNNINL